MPFITISHNLVSAQPQIIFPVLSQSYTVSNPNPKISYFSIAIGSYKTFEIKVISYQYDVM